MSGYIITANGARHEVCEYDGHGMWTQYHPIQGRYSNPFTSYLPVTIWLANSAAISDCGVGTQVRLFLDHDGILGLGLSATIVRREANTLHTEIDAKKIMEVLPCTPN